MEMTLLLNSTFEPMRVISWKKAILLLVQDKVEVLQVHNREIRSVSISFKLPSVLRLLSFVKIKANQRVVKFSRSNIFARDKHHCQYCGRHFKTSALTFDHVLPIAKGGKKTWTNIVTACIRCNNRKSGHTPEEANMRLIKKPEKPRWSPMRTITIGLRNMPLNWRDYLYWHLSLEEDPSP
ncbi:HNH endonuclease [Nitrospira defluvii]|nr:HNH endonuclease [Nitrospira defluvii]